MDKYAEQLKIMLDEAPHMQKHIFEKGFLITDAEIENENEFPFYGNWDKTVVGGFSFWLFRGVKLYTAVCGESTLFLIGHAYNPYSMDYEEDVILKKAAAAYGTEDYQELLNELTGVYITGAVKPNGIEIQLDASGMQYGCYGEVEGRQYIASHMRLIGDICNLTTSDYVSRLVSYRWYHYMMGNYMPGDITCFEGIKRIIPNTCVSLKNGEYSVTRFYPNKEIKMAETEEEYAEVIAEGARVLKNTMALIAKKWSRPAISLTGGVDSNTTFAAANGLYGKFESFSYVAMYRESVDAEKAEEISSRFGVKHTTYQIPDSNDEVPDFALYRAIFEHNDGNIGRYKENDTRKKIVLINADTCEVEVKSWISETIRAYAYKYFGRTSYPKSLSPRNYTSIYKIFLLDRRLARETDGYFAEYIKNTDLKAHLYNYDESDFFVWEMMHGGKCGLNIGVMKQCHDITIPYNNRKWLDTLLRVPLEYRISDRHHMDMKKLMNEELYEMGIRVVNLNETKLRKRAINMYYVINSALYLKDE